MALYLFITILVSLFFTHAHTHIGRESFSVSVLAFHPVLLLVLLATTPYDFSNPTTTINTPVYAYVTLSGAAPLVGD